MEYQHCFVTLDLDIWKQVFTTDGYIGSERTGYFNFLWLLMLESFTYHLQAVHNLSYFVPR